MAVDSPLRVQARKNLQDTLSRYGQSPSLDQANALHDLMDTMVDMANGISSSCYYLSSLDPGLGKTTAVVSFLQALCASNQHPGVAALVCMARREEIRDILKDAGLPPESFAVLAGKAPEGPRAADWVDLDDLSPTPPHQARVLFTTQAMVRVRCAGQASFGEVSDFHYQGHPRQVRIWDETFDVAEGLAVDLDAIARVLKTLRDRSADTTDALDDLRDVAKRLDDGTVYPVPDLASPFGLALKDILRRHGHRLSSDDRDILQQLTALSGQHCVVRHHQNKRFLLGKATPIPADIAPVVILDASGRVRETYALWERHRGNLKRLEGAAKDYGHLTIHHWPKGGGRETIKADVPTYADAVASVINSRPDEDWLVVHHKEEDGFDFAEAIRVTLDKPDRVEFLTWGRHHGTNRYGHIRNVILVGAMYQRDMDYEGRWHACADIPPNRQRCPEDDRAAVEEGEYRHMVLQALCRAVVRRNDNGACPPCTAYVIAKKGDVVGNLRRTFPGVDIRQWYPSTLEIGGKAGEALQVIRDWLDNGAPGGLLPYTAIARAIGYPPRSFHSKVRQHPKVIARLREWGVTEAGGRGTRTTGFAKMPSELDEVA
ncbi:hypothetical protein [Nitrospirillum sp. BR 11163]|uniref:hypothetical protein n=1 Tax=Nitrospirillum sp. BR 11163 TaxID=3104323 RepID=UPI002B0038DB|nr:hypothetical protein [Nitrospirillum sp. BR 11163]MEA1675251.1 hypothetical protein [Nitrospirillum sp. BR 11163]